MTEKISKLADEILPMVKKNKKTALIIVFCFVLMVLILLSEIPFSSKAEETIKTEGEKEYSLFNSEEIEKFLENISGAGEVKIMITYDTSTEYIYACDTSENKDIEDNTKTEINYKSEHIIIKEDNKEGGLQVKEIYPKIRGVAVICEGGGNPIIKEQIIDILSALFDINSNRISVAAKAA